MRLLLAALALFGCPGDDDDDDPPVVRVWSLEQSELPPALLAVHGIGGDDGDILSVGGPLTGEDTPALSRRQDGSWSDVAPPAGWQGAIWWSWSSAASDVWVVGDRGQVAHGSIDALAKLEIGTSTHTVLYGVWGSGPDDVYVVGGSPRSPSGPSGTILHWDGATLSPLVLTGTASIAHQVNLFKVWGSGRDDVMIVGTGGLAIEKRGDRWTVTRTNTNVQLTTVHGRGPFEKYAVGGLNQGVVMRYDGFTWTEIGEQFAPPISGVFAAPDGLLWVAGDGGYLAAYDGLEWTVVETQLFTQFHAVYVGETEVFGVGGILSLSSDPRMGFVGRYGP